MMAASILLGVEARLAKTDAMLLFTIVAAMGVLARVYLPPRSASARGGSRWTLPAIFWTALAAGILFKGPLIVMVVGLAARDAVVIDRSARWLLGLRPLAGLVWLLLLVLPWFVAIYARVRRRLLRQFGRPRHAGQIAQRPGNPRRAARQLFRAVLGDVLAGRDPGRAGGAGGVGGAARAAARFLLAWLVPSWIVFELVVTKLPHYVLPLYPAIAILIAGVVEANALSRGSGWCGARRGGSSCRCCSSVAVIVVRHRSAVISACSPGRSSPARSCSGCSPGGSTTPTAPSASLLRACGGLDAVAIGAVRRRRSGARAGVSERPIAARAARGDAPHPVAAASAIRSRAWCSWPAPRRGSPTAPARPISWPGALPLRLGRARQERGFAQRADAIGLRYEPGPRIEGINISNGQPITMAVFARERAVTAAKRVRRAAVARSAPASWPHAAVCCLAGPRAARASRAAWRRRFAWRSIAIVTLCGHRRQHVARRPAASDGAPLPQWFRMFDR